MTSLERYALIEWAEAEIERLRTLLEASAVNDAANRGAITVHRALLERLRPTIRPETPAPDYGFGGATVAPDYTT